MDSVKATRPSAVRGTSFSFALRVVGAFRYLQDERREFVMSNQLLRSGTAIGALVREAEQAESKADFIHKMAIGLKEANETVYWIALLTQSEYLDAKAGDSLQTDATVLLKWLTSIVKTAKSRR